MADDPAPDGLPSGILAYADLTASDVDEVLEGQCAPANMRGIRDMLNFAPDTPRFCFAARGDLMQDQAWRAGYARLRAHGLSFDLQLWWQQMADAARLAADFGIDRCMWRPPCLVPCVVFRSILTRIYSRRKRFDSYADFLYPM